MGLSGLKRCQIISQKELDSILENLKWVLKDSAHTLKSGVQGFGATDYKDHQKDSLDELKSLMIDGVKQRRQLGHYYDSNGEQVDTIAVSGYRGGYTATFIYKSGSNAFNRK